MDRHGSSNRAGLRAPGVLHGPELALLRASAPAGCVPSGAGPHYHLLSAGDHGSTTTRQSNSKTAAKKYQREDCSKIFKTSKAACKNREKG